jgi:hypothetical protein
MYFSTNVAAYDQIVALAARVELPKSYKSDLVRVDWEALVLGAYDMPDRFIHVFRICGTDFVYPLYNNKGLLVHTAEEYLLVYQKIFGDQQVYTYWDGQMLREITPEEAVLVARLELDRKPDYCGRIAAAAERSPA